MIIAIDFDGTICRGAFPNIDGAMPYAKDVITQLKNDGHYLIVWTCRTGKPLLDAINWLVQNGIPFDRVNDHNPANVAKYGDGGPKVYAHCYIDDKNIGGFPGWLQAKELIDAEEAKWLKKQTTAEFSANRLNVDKRDIAYWKSFYDMFGFYPFPI